MVSFLYILSPPILLFTFESRLSFLLPDLTPAIPGMKPLAPSLKESATGIDWKKHKEKLEISKNYTIVPAYNKGPYMVVPIHELHTAGKKV